MFRELTALILLTAALPTAALARDPAVAEQRTETRELRKEDRQVDRLIRKWSKAADKGKVSKLDRLDEDIHELTVAELSRLRQAGVRTVPAPPRWADQPQKVRDPHPRMEQLRDQMVELRELSASDGTSRRELNRTEALLGSLSANVDGRLETAERRLDALKG
ncbi:MAG: hypothetical protein H6738_21465 [Alphaproteobacteria bacterium]|nr:hypothetical protein [Alphaproteobacteria bacterium]